MRASMADLPDEDLIAAHRVLDAVSNAIDVYRAELADHIDVSET